MKRVRKYTYVPQEEIKVIETKSGETIKSKQILDGNYVKAKPAPKKVVKKAVKKVVKKKYADGGEIEIGDKVKYKNAKYHATVTDVVDNVEIPYAKITYSDGRVKKAYLEDLQKVTLGIAPEYVNPDYMAKGGETEKLYTSDEVITILSDAGYEVDEYNFDELATDEGFKYIADKNGLGGMWYRTDDFAKGGKTPIVRTQFEEEEFEYADGGEFKGYKADKKEKFTYTLTGEELRKFKYRSFSEQIENAIKFKELIEKVYEAQPEGDIYPIEFIKAQARTTFSMGKDDKGKIYVLGTYGRGSFTHFPFLNDKNFIEALKYVDRPAIRKFMADGGMLDEDEAKARKSILRDRNRLVQMNVGKDDKSLNFAIKLIDMLLDGELHSVSDINDVDGEAKARKAIMRDRNRLVQMNVGKDDKSLNFAIKLIDMLLDGELDNTMAKGGSVGGQMGVVKSYWNKFDKKRRIEFLESAGYSKSVATDLSSESWDSLEKGVHKDLLSVIMADGGTITTDQLKKIERKYKLNEDKNYHSENLVLLADAFGSEQDKIEAKRILALHREEGHLSSENGKKRIDLYSKLLKAWDKEREKAGIEYADGGMMTAEVMRNVTHYDVTITAQPKTDSRNWANFVTFDTRVQTRDRQEAIRKAKLEFYAMYPNEKIMKIVAEPDTSAYIPDMPAAYGFADGGKVTDKEVAESNVEMLHSNIKSIKHHAEELEHAIKDNTEVEGWVLAKADRAATAMSDITHYLDGRKMGRGGMVAGHYYKDKAGSDLRYIGPDSKNDDLGIFKDGEKYLTKPFDEFEEEKEKKSFWFGNGGFMPSGFSRKVTLSEKAEEMVGKNTWHILDAAQKGEVIGELISDGALAVTMDRGGIVDADDWSKSMTQDKIYALKKAGYSENIASEMSLLPYEQLPMWVRQDFKKGSIVIGAYHIHKNDNIPVDGKVLVLNGDEEVVYSAETLDQAQEWAINQMQEVEDDNGDYVWVSDCCGAEAGSSYDIGICPMCREHCEWEKESTYADGGVTEATKFKVVYKLRDAAEPKEKLFDNAENAEFFLETIKEDDDIMSANLVEVKPMKKAAEKKAPTNLFAAAKPAAASSASKKTKEDVLVPGIADRIARYDALKAIIKNAEAEKEVIGGALKEVGKEKFLELYELRRRNPETFNLADEDEKIMFIVMDKYIKVEPEKAGMLENYPGLLETTTTYKFNPALLDKTGEIVSRLILESTELSDDEKANLIVAETKIGIKSGSIDRLMDYDNPSQIFDLIEPILALK